jgi:DNA-binding NarL/FixJ family response regulator
VIVIHIECNDEAFRAVVAELLDHQGDMRVLRADAERASDAERDEQPDVVVFGLSPLSDVTLHAPDYREVASSGAAVVVFCTAPDQAADFQELGVEYLVDADEPARELAAAVRAAYRQRSGRRVH